MKVNRRHFLRGATRVTVGASLVGLYSWQVEPFWVEVVERDMPLRGLPAGLEGKKVVQLSDLHVSTLVDSAYLRRAIGQAMDLQPDLVMITGDLMTSVGNEQVEPAAKLIRQLDPDNTPILVTPGNHEYGRYCSVPQIVESLFASLNRIGCHTLRNEIFDYEGLQIVGCDDLFAHRFDAARTLRHYDLGRDGIAMSHNPDSVDQPGWESFTGWVLAGHTHGGQCRVPYFGAPIVPVENKLYTAGHVDLEDGRQLYVNRGLGYSRPVRFLARPEITLFRLTSA